MMCARPGAHKAAAGWFTHQEVWLCGQHPVKREGADAQQLGQVNPRPGGLQDLDRRVDCLLGAVVCEGAR